MGTASVKSRSYRSRSHILIAVDHDFVVVGEIAEVAEELRAPRAHLARVVAGGLGGMQPHLLPARGRLEQRGIERVRRGRVVARRGERLRERPWILAAPEAAKPPAAGGQADARPRLPEPDHPPEDHQQRRDAEHDDELADRSTHAGVVEGVSEHAKEMRELLVDPDPEPVPRRQPPERGGAERLVHGAPDLLFGNGCGGLEHAGR